MGAYIGDSALILLEYTNKKVYAFEAILLHYKLMLETIKQNKFYILGVNNEQKI